MESNVGTSGTLGAASQGFQCYNCAMSISFEVAVRERNDRFDLENRWPMGYFDQLRDAMKMDQGLVDQIRIQMNG